MQCVEQLDLPAFDELDFIEAFPVVREPACYVFPQSVTESETTCTVTVTYAGPETYNGVFCYAQSPFGLERFFIHAHRAGGSSGASGSGSSGWGHSWVTIENAKGIQTSYGFWPRGGASPSGALLGRHYPGELAISIGQKDSPDSCPDETYVVDISPETYRRLVHGLEYFQRQGYTWALSFNCTDFAVMIAQWAGVKIGDVSTKGWSDPDRLADWITNQNKQRAR